jgi:hypothetical protein
LGFGFLSIKEVIFKCLINFEIRRFHANNERNKFLRSLSNNNSDYSGEREGGKKGRRQKKRFK